MKSLSFYEKRHFHQFPRKSFFQNQMNIVDKIRSVFNVEMIKIGLFLFFQNFLVVGASVGMFIVANHVVLKRDMPPLTGGHSALNLQPGLTILPRPDSLTSLIRFRMARRQTYGSYIHDLLSFTHEYERFSQRSRLMDCTKFISYMDHPKFSCRYSLDLGTKSCNIFNTYGFDNGNPCMLLKLNRIFGWIPDLNATNESVEFGFPTIKIKCEGVSDFDKESVGKICYYDEENSIRYQTTLDTDFDCQSDYAQIRNYYFPYKKQKNYQNPFVWIKFLELKRHVAIMVRCWAQANNIVVDFNYGLGSTQFEIIMD